MTMLSAGDWIGIGALLVACVGLFGIWYQVRQSSRDATAGALLSSIAGRWQTIEEMKYRLRVHGRDVNVRHKGIENHLRHKLRAEFDDDPMEFAAAFELGRIDLGDEDDRAEAVVNEAIKEYRVRDLIFSLCEDEYMAHELDLIQREDLWDYWKWYIDQTFQDASAIHYWEIRREFGTTYEGFVGFVESTYFGGQAST